ncbi:MAG: FtsW/RodA/SpoVE family cell cycle protein [Phycisphaerae bacterium]
MLETLLHNARHTSWPIVIAMICLMLLGVQAIRVSEQADPMMRAGSFSAKQITFAVFGLVSFVAVTFIPYKRLGQGAYAIFGLTLALLVLVLFLPPIRGSHRWIDLKVIMLQPSEVAKLSYIILLAWYLRRGGHYRRLRGLIIPFVLTLIPLGLILKEPDLGTSLLFLPTLYFMLFMAGAKLKHLLSIVAIGTILVLLPVPVEISPGWDRNELLDRESIAYARYGDTLVVAAPLAKMEPHQLSRIVGWLRQDDPRVAMGKGYHLHQSKIVLGSGRLTGTGDWGDASVYFRMLPDDHTDFIFSVIGGRWGFLGCLLVLILYAVILLFGVEIALTTNDPFGRLLSIGVLALLFWQVVINVGMTMGLMPITGMTLPLVSYGGSSLVINCVAIAILIKVGQTRSVTLAPKPFEYGQKRDKSAAATAASETMGLDRPGKDEDDPAKAERFKRTEGSTIPR